MDQKFLAGVGRAIITPPIGTILHGYAPGRPAESVADDLTVTAVAVESETAAAILLSVTVCSIGNDTADRLRKLIGDATGIPADHVLVSPTHTHSGPNTSKSSGWGMVNQPYIDNTLIPCSVKAAQEAWKSRRGARLGIGTTFSEVGINRREIRANGTIVLGQNPWGPYDPVMTVLSFKGDDGEIIANIIHYCAHCTGSGCNPEITRDWAGPMIDRLEEQSGGITGFYNGAEGDIGPRIANGGSTGTLKLAYELGGRAALDAVRAWRSIHDWRKVEVAAITDDIHIPYNPLPSRAEAQAEIDKIGDLDLWPDNYKKYAAVNELMKWRGVIAEHDSSEPVKTHYVLRQTIIAIGPAAFVPFPFEMFVEITLRIRKDSPYQHTLCLSNTNGSVSYFPTQDQLCRGGYEIWAFKAGNVYSMVDDADTFAVQENLRLIKALHS
ncbi:MAG: hypothetical protein SCM11_17375 [Bacillota bacterium]|nr:hypothetical protein [Bacillota bacterium]